MNRGILISGASSGIGAALARAAAAPGVTLGLTGRDAGRLAVVAAEAVARGATVRSATFDIRDTAALTGFVQDLAAQASLDLVVANAGILDGAREPGAVEDREIARAVLSTNLDAALDLVHAVLPRMREARTGQIALMSSLSAFAPLPDAPSYSASKAALLAYGLALREALRPDGLRVSVICPGYVATRMTDRHFGPQPFQIDAERAAAAILRGLARDAAIIGFPWPIYMAARLSALLPAPLRSLVMARMRFTVGQAKPEPGGAAPC